MLLDKSLAFQVHGFILQRLGSLQVCPCSGQGVSLRSASTGRFFLEGTCALGCQIDWGICPLISSRIHSALTHACSMSDREGLRPSPEKMCESAAVKYANGTVEV